jgi:hypothetical protein
MTVWVISEGQETVQVCANSDRAVEAMKRRGSKSFEHSPDGLIVGDSGLRAEQWIVT